MLKKVAQLLVLFFISIVSNASEPLKPDDAFKLSVYLNDKNQLVMHWLIAPGYYLYRDKITFTTEATSHIKLKEITFPQGAMQHDPLHGSYQVFTHNISIPISLDLANKGVLTLDVSYQGCSKFGFCYSPIKKYVSVNLNKLEGATNLTKQIKVAELQSSKQAQLGQFGSDNLLFTMLGFLGLGLLLAFTPCVLPMVPILSGIILGQSKKHNKSKALGLSVAYVGGMAITYAIFGVIIALIGSNFQAKLQQPWVIILFSCLFVLLALSLFGFYELSLPARLQNFITKISNRQKGGSFLGVFIMGGLSTLIVSPCVSAPLVGVLAYIGQTGNVLIGASALLLLGIGMGIPLILIGVSADKFLPKAGSWMLVLERIFGFCMLGLSVMLLSRLLPGPVTLFLWAAVFIGAAVYLTIFANFSRGKWLARSVSVLLFIYGVILGVGAGLGNSSLINPLAEIGFLKKEVRNNKVVFTYLKDMRHFEQLLADAKKAKQPVILDFWAQWCVSCVAMDRTIFSQPEVAKALQNIKVLRADVTKGNDFDQEISKRFEVVGPPTVIFFDSNGDEVKDSKMVGEHTLQEFLDQVEAVKEKGK